MAKGAGAQTTTQVSDPWKGQQPYLSDIFQNAQSTFRSGAGSEFFPGETSTPLSADTVAGMDAIRAQAGQTPAGLPEAEGVAQQAMTGGQANRMDVINNAASGGMSNPMLAGLMRAARGVTTAGRGPLMAAAMGALPITAGATPLEASARGEYLNSNPMLSQVIDQAAGKIRDNTAAVFAKGGRYGSQAHQATLEDSVGDMASRVLADNYSQERGRQMQAATELGGRQASDIATRIGAATTQAGIQQNDLSRQGGLMGQLAGFGEQGLNRQLGAAGEANAYGLNQTAQGLQATGLLPMLRQLGQAGGQDLLGLGRISEDQADEEKQAELDRWNFEQQAPWDMLGRYSGIIGGLGNLGGTTTTTAPKAKSGGGASGALGGALTGAAMTAFMRWLGAGVGGLAGYFL